MEYLSDKPEDRDYVAHTRIAMSGLDKWLADAERVLIGRHIVRTGAADRRRGSVNKIQWLTVAHSASGYHLFLTAGPDERLLELGVNCELLEEG